jgi:hypothetical protein
LAALDNLELFGAEIRDRMPCLVYDSYIEANEIHAGPERRLRERRRDAGNEQGEDNQTEWHGRPPGGILNS